MSVQRNSGKDATLIASPVFSNDFQAAPAAAKSAAPASPETKAKAEKAKSLGNQLMAAKDYPGAIKAYGDAIELDGTAPTYYSNRYVL